MDKDYIEGISVSISYFLIAVIGKLSTSWTRPFIPVGFFI